VRRRLLISYLSLTVFVLLALELPLGLSFANAEHRRLTGQVQTDAYALALRVGEAMADTPAPDVLQHLANSFHRQTGLRAVVVDAAGSAVAASGPHEPAVGTDLSGMAEIAAAARGRQTTADRVVRSEDVLSTTVPVVSSKSAVGAVRVSASLAVVAQRTREHWLLLAGLGGVVAMVVLLVSTLLARSFTRPLAELDAGAARLGEGDLAARVRVPDDPPELHGLARSFNATAARLETLVLAQQAFVADASHQLRTPLTALSLRLENLEEESSDFRLEDLQGARTEVQRLARLVDGLLTLARAEDATAPTANVDVASVLAGRRNAWEPVAAERGVELQVDREAPDVRSVPGRLEQILDNLISNALDVAPAGSAVTVRARRDGAQVRVEVGDGGPGMTPEQRARAFDRFWRAEPSRRDRGGFGLGLAIVGRLVAADGGTVELTDAPQGGLAVVLRLPAAPASIPLGPVTVTA
jgi:signal transduction histidine kinase